MRCLILKQQGFISLHRKLMNNPIWVDPYYLKLWMYCLFEASHKEYDLLLGNQLIKLKRGQLVKGRFSLADDMNKGMKPKQKLSERTWWRHLENLEKWGMLNINSTNKYSVITIDKYELYQDVFNKSDQQLTNSCPTDDQQLTTNNNVNNANNVNKKELLSPKLKFSDDDLKIVEFFISEIQTNFPNFTTLAQKTWANEIRLMVEKDKRDRREICEVIRFSQKDEFWYPNIQSVKKLRKHYNTLLSQLKKNNQSKKQIIENKEDKELGW